MASCRLGGMIDEASVHRQYELLRPSLDERGRRLFAASQVRALGYGQGCSTLLTDGQAEQIVEPSESRPVAVLADGVGLVGA
jgi:hypothetical protein